MRRFRFLGFGAILLVLWWLVAPPGSGAREDGVDRVEVTNFPGTQTVDGRVRVTEPVPQTRHASNREIVYLGNRWHAGGRGSRPSSSTAEISSLP